NRRPNSPRLAARIPRPGENRLTASSRLVFPAPFGPNRNTLRPPGVSSARSYERKFVSARDWTAARILDPLFPAKAGTQAFREARRRGKAGRANHGKRGRQLSGPRPLSVLSVFSVAEKTWVPA